VNHIPRARAFWRPSARTIWDVYEDAITHVTLPSTTLTARQQSELERAQAFLTTTATTTDPVTGARRQVIEDTPQYTAYREHQTAYLAALSSHNGMEIQANVPGASNALVQDWARNGGAYRSQVASAWSAWVADGCKDDVEEALGTVRTLAGQGPATLYEVLRGNLAADQMTDTLGQAFHPAYLSLPDPLMPALKASWVRYEWSLRDLQMFSATPQTDSGSSAGPGWGLWCSGASAQYGSGQKSFECDTTGLMVQAELLQMPLKRAWLRPEVFGSRGWCWSPRARFGLLSNGGIPPDGLMPLYPASVILAKDVAINLDMTSRQNQSSWSSISAGASFGWGPFSISGNVIQPGASAESHFMQSLSGISVPGPQIIAFMCEMLPKAPDPDPNLPWPAGLGRM
jgi:hypothetical protein